MSGSSGIVLPYLIPIQSGKPFFLAAAVVTDSVQQGVTGDGDLIRVLSAKQQWRLLPQNGL